MNEENGILKLLEQIKNGDESAFAEFYSQTYKYVYSRAKCMFSDEEEVQDLVQEVYLALYRNVTTIQSSESIFGWLKTTTFYQGTKMLKKRRKEVLLSEDGEEMFEAIPDDEPQIEEGYMNQEDVEVIRECINRLSDEQKTVLLAYYYDNLKVNEIADILSLSAGTVKSRLYLARKNLQVYIEEEEKKRGYKLHSFGAVTLALALRMFLQGNMEVAGSAEETIFARVCERLNTGYSAEFTAGTLSTTEGDTTKNMEEVVEQRISKVTKSIIKKTAEMGAKRFSLMMAGVVMAVTIASATIGGVINEKSEDSMKLGVDKNYTTTREWQTDYAKILIQTYFLTEEAAKIYENDWDELNSPQAGVFFGLLDVNGDDVPELFVGSSEHTPYAGEVFMFTAGSTMKECYVGRIYSGFFENGEIVRTDIGEETDYTVCKFNGKELVEIQSFELNDELYEKYIGEFNLIFEENWLDVDTILRKLGVEISEKDKELLNYAPLYFSSDNDSRVAEIYFNSDEIPDLMFDEGNFIRMFLSDTTGYKVNDFYVSDNNDGYCTYVEKAGKLIRHQGDSVSLVEYDEEGEIVFSASVGKDTQMLYTYGVYEEKVIYNYAENNQGREITEEEYEQKYNELCANEREMYGSVQYESFDEVFDAITFTLKEQGEE